MTGPCEFVDSCENIIDFISLAGEKGFAANPKKEERYLALQDQYNNLCIFGSSLQDGSLECGLRNKYLSITPKILI